MTSILLVARTGLLYLVIAYDDAVHWPFFSMHRAETRLHILDQQVKPWKKI
jgi:hypothetical protein